MNECPYEIFDASLERDGANKKMGETACSEESFRYSKYNQPLFIFRFCICRFNQPWIKNIREQKIPESSKKVKLESIALANISTAFTPSTPTSRPLFSLLPISSSQTGLLCFLSSKFQAPSHFRVLILAVPSTWNILTKNTCMYQSHTSIKCLFKGHNKGAFAGHPT